MQADLFSYISYLYDSLIQAGVEFNEDGYPLIPSKHLITELPDEIIPFDRRNECKDPARTVLCYFRNDEYLYPRLNRLKEDNRICLGFMGVCGFDLSPRRGYDIRLQQFNLLTNRMVDAYRAIHGVHILPNFRTGDLSTLSSLTYVPSGSWFIAGTRGCARGYLAENSSLLKAKLIYTRPEHLLIYGRLRPEYAAILNDFGQSYTVYENYQDKSRGHYCRLFA